MKVPYHEQRRNDEQVNKEVVQDDQEDYHEASEEGRQDGEEASQASQEGHEEGFEEDDQEGHEASSQACHAFDFSVFTSDWGLRRKRAPHSLRCPFFF